MTVDALVAVALVVGSGLAALGAVGLVRFPDVFTRMHAATKVATVGVILLTAAAGLRTGAWGLAIAVLVVALLFLSGPLGMSLLARAAYHDPETPRAWQTAELSARPTEPETSSASRGTGANKTLVLWLLIVWTVVFGSLGWHVVVSGVAVAAVVAWTFRRITPPWANAAVHPVGVLRFVMFFIGQLTGAVWDVTKALFVPTTELRPAVLEVPIQLVSRNEVALLMNAVSFTPGTVALEMHEDRLLMHVLSTKPIASIEADVAALQARIAKAFEIPRRLGNANRVSEDV